MQIPEKFGEIGEFLGNREYAYFGESFNNHKNVFLFQRKYSTALGKRYVNVWMYNCSPSEYSIIRERSYEIEATFETEECGWMTAKYYGQTEQQLIDKLEEMEDKLYETFVLCHGLCK